MTANQWDDPTPAWPHVRWRWRRWRAAHYAWLADVNFRRWPTRRNHEALERAVDFLAHVEAARP